MIEFIIATDRGRGHVNYLANNENGFQWITVDRKRAQAFPNLKAAQEAANEYLLEAIDHGGLFAESSMTFGMRIEVRLVEGDDGDVTEEQALGLREILRRHHKEPVLPMSEFCDAISTWFRCIEDANAADDAEDHTQGHSYYQHLGRIELDIRKSALLARLLYGGESLRTRKCPEHKGRWSGLESPDNQCEHGCGLTGWLPNQHIVRVRYEYEGGTVERFLAKDDKDDKGWHTTDRDKAQVFDAMREANAAIVSARKWLGSGEVSEMPLPKAKIDIIEVDESV